MTNPNDMEILARRRVDLKEQADAIAAAIAAIDAQIVDAVEVGGVVAIGDEPVWRVQQRRTFDPDRARELVSPEVIAAATVEAMTDRRPHWDDYLLASVMIHCNDIEQCYAVIAAVEDWQVANARDRVYLAEPTSAEQAAIARVREECARIPYNGNAAWTAGYTAACQRVRRALDGER